MNTVNIIPFRLQIYVSTTAKCFDLHIGFPQALTTPKAHTEERNVSVLSLHKI